MSNYRRLISEIGDVLKSPLAWVSELEKILVKENFTVDLEQISRIDKRDLFNWEFNISKTDKYTEENTYGEFVFAVSDINLTLYHVHRNDTDYTPYSFEKNQQGLNNLVDYLLELI